MPEEMTLDQWRARKNDAPASGGGVSLDEWRARKAAPAELLSPRPFFENQPGAVPDDYQPSPGTPGRAFTPPRSEPRVGAALGGASGNVAAMDEAEAQDEALSAHGLRRGGAPMSTPEMVGTALTRPIRTALSGVLDPVTRNMPADPDAIDVGRGILGSALGAVTLPLAPAITASEALREEDAAGRSVNPVGRAAAEIARWTPAPLPLGAFEAVGEHVQKPLEEAAQHAKQRGDVNAERAAKGTALLTDLVALKAAHSAGRGLGKVPERVSPFRRPSVPEMGLPPVVERGALARPVAPPEPVRVGRPAPVEAPKADVPGLPPGGTGPTNVAGVDIAAQRNLRPKPPAVEATLGEQTVKAKPFQTKPGGTETANRPLSLDEWRAQKASVRTPEPPVRAAEPVSTTPETATRAQPAPAVGGPRAPGPKEGSRVTETPPQPEAAQPPSPVDRGLSRPGLPQREARPVGAPEVAEPPLVQRVRDALRTDGPEEAGRVYREAAKPEKDAVEAFLPKPDRPMFGGSRLLKYLDAETPREGPKGLGRKRMGPESGAVAIPTKGDINPAITGAMETVRGGYEAATSKIGDAVSAAVDRIPAARAVRDALSEGFQTPQERVAPGKGGRAGRLQIAEGRRLGSQRADLRLAAKSARRVARIPDGARDGVYRYMNGESPTLPMLSAKDARAVHDLMGFIEAARNTEHALGYISDQALAEYPRFLIRHMKLRDLAERGSSRQFRQGGAPKVDRNQYRQDAFGGIATMPLAESLPIAQKHGGIALPGGRSSLVKFETAAARDAFKAEVDARMPPGKSRLSDTFDPLPNDLRLEYGEVTDPAQAAALTLARSYRRIANDAFLKQLEPLGKGDAKGEWVRKPTFPGATPPKGMELVSDPTLKPIDGKWVRTDVLDAVRGSMTAEATVNAGKLVKGAVDFWTGARSGWAASHLTWNPGTQARNLASMLHIGIAGGVNPLNPLNATYWARAIKVLLSRGKDWDAALREGVVKQDFLTSEMQSLIADAVGKSESVPEVLGRMAAGELWAPARKLPGKAGRAAGTVDRAMRDVYSAPDDIGRLVKWYELRDTMKGATPDQIMGELEASTYNYARQGPAPKFIRKTPIVGPGLAFSHETFRILAHNLRAHPIRAVEMLTATALINEAIQSFQTADEKPTDEEEDAAKQEFGGNLVSMGRKDDTGNSLWFDARYVDPLGQLLAGPDSGVGRSWRRVGEWMMQIISGGETPAAEGLRTLATGKDRWAREVYSPLDTEGGNVAGAAWNAWRTVLGPPLIGRQWDKFRAAQRDQPFSPKRPKQDVPQVALSMALGGSAGELDTSLQRKGVKSQFDWLEREIRRAGKAERRAGADGEESFAKQDRALESIRGDRDELVETLDAATRKGPAR